MATLNRKKRGKLTKILIAPVAALIFLVGWSFYCIGQAGHKKQKLNKTATKPENVQLMFIPLQEEQAITNQQVNKRDKSI
jgi:flagellar basal body-associated protein FliL